MHAYIKEIGRSKRELEWSGGERGREREKESGAGVRMYPAGKIERAGRCVFATS